MKYIHFQQNIYFFVEWDNHKNLYRDQSLPVTIFLFDKVNGLLFKHKAYPRLTNMSDGDADLVNIMFCKYQRAQIRFFLILIRFTKVSYIYLILQKTWCRKKLSRQKKHLKRLFHCHCSFSFGWRKRSFKSKQKRSGNYFKKNKNVSKFTIGRIGLRFIHAEINLLIWHRKVIHRISNTWQYLEAPAPCGYACDRSHVSLRRWQSTPRRCFVRIATSCSWRQYTRIMCYRISSIQINENN